MMKLTKILIVEDALHIMNIYKRYIEIEYKNSDIQVETAENGIDALIKLQNFKPELILTDLMMPLMNGIDLIKNIRSNNELEKIKIIVITSVCKDDEIYKELSTLNIDGILVKPINRSDLFNMIKNVFDNKTEIDFGENINKIKFLSGNDLINKWISKMNDSEMQNIIFDLIKTLPDRLHKIKQYIIESNIKELKKETHTLKGTTGTLGMEEIYLLSSKMHKELNNETHDFHKINEIASEIEEIVLKVCG